MTDSPDDIIVGLRAYQEIHRLWVDHLEHCRGCADCAVEVVSQVGTVEKHRRDIDFYETVIAEIERLRALDAPPQEPFRDVIGEMSMAAFRAEHANDAPVHPHERVQFSQMDMDRATKPLHVEIERLKALVAPRSRNEHISDSEI